MTEMLIGWIIGAVIVIPYVVYKWGYLKGYRDGGDYAMKLWEDENK